MVVVWTGCHHGGGSLVGGVGLLVEGLVMALLIHHIVLRMMSSTSTRRIVVDG